MVDQIEDSQYFIEQVSTFDVTPEYMDLHLTNYDLNNPKIRKVIGECSPKRLVTIDDCVLRPGHGEGMLHLDDQTYPVSYAWRGFTESDAKIGEKDFHTVISWTVRIRPEEEGEAFKNRMDDYFQGIYLDEGGKLQYDLPKKEWFKKVVQCKPATIAGYRKYLEDAAKTYKKEARQLFLKEHPEMVAGLDAMHSPENIEKQIAEVKGKDTIIYTPLWTHPQEINPWLVLQKD